jgi:hypothetical protein
VVRKSALRTTSVALIDSAESIITASTDQGRRFPLD